MSKKTTKGNITLVTTYIRWIKVWPFRSINYLNLSLEELLDLDSVTEERLEEVGIYALQVAYTYDDGEKIVNSNKKIQMTADFKRVIRKDQEQIVPERFVVRDVRFDVSSNNFNLKAFPFKKFDDDVKLFRSNLENAGVFKVTYFLHDFNNDELVRRNYQITKK